MSPGPADAVIWHDLECGSYNADLAYWAQLAEQAGGPILDLGCGAGRVALHLAGLGHEVLGIDSDPPLVEVLNARAANEQLPAGAEVGDATSLSLDRNFPLILAPMQLANLLDERERRSCLASIREHLEPEGVAAVAVMDEVELGDAPPLPPLPDVSEQGEWIYSSLPVGIEQDDGELVVRRLRQIVSPGGELSEEPHSFRLFLLSPKQLEVEARDAGLSPAGTQLIEPTPDHVGSVVVLLRRV